MEEEANFIYQDRGQRRDHTEPPPYRVALHQRHDTLDPGVDGGAPRLGELRARRRAAGREILREQAVSADRLEDGGDLRRRELGGSAARLRKALGDQRAEQPRLQPRVVDVAQKTSAAGASCHRGLWPGRFGLAAAVCRGG